VTSIAHADWLGVAAALDAVLAHADSLPAVHLPLTQAHGHVLAEEVVSPVDLPLWDNSAMDGFAVRGADLTGAAAGNPITLRVVDDVPAGARSGRTVGAGEAIRVMTGAPVPDGADTVVRVEHTDGGTGIGGPDAAVRILSDADARRHVRPRGEDVRAGDRLLEPGRLLGPAEIGVAASVGRARLRVVRRPVVAILTSGDELVDVDGFGRVVSGERIVSSSTYALAAQVREAGAEPRVLGIARDTPESVREHVLAARGADVLVTTAGVAVGEHDHMLRVLDGLGLRLAFWRVRMRPGSAFACGRLAELGGIPWFGLPGNPVSSMVVFELFVRPALLRMAGEADVFAPVVPARPDFPLRAAPERAEFLRVRLHPADAGEYRATLTGPQGSGILTSMVGADALLHLPPETQTRTDGSLAAIVLGGRPLRAYPAY
jgi:molybdopterin molybdotransferase